MKNSSFNNSLGQSLLEITIMLGVAIVIITGLTVVTINGLKNSQFAQNQVQATKLAQEGLESVKLVKNRNCKVNLSGASTDYYWSNVPDTQLIWGASIESAKTFVADTSNCSLAQNNDARVEQLLNGRFQRSITLIKSADNQSITVTVVTSWTDISGTHQSKLATILAKY